MANSKSTSKNRPARNLILRQPHQPLTRINLPGQRAKFPLCDAAVRKMEGGEWDLADAILAECSETGEDGVQE